MFARIRSNVGKASVIGRLVSLDQRGALVVAELLERDSSTGKTLDYRAVADQLEAIRTHYETGQIDIRIIGFATDVGAVSDARREVLIFFALALLPTLPVL